MPSSNTGIFGGLISKTGKLLDDAKLKRERESLESQEEKTQERKQQGRSFSEEMKQRAVEHTKNKALMILSNRTEPLSRKIAAINELHKEHTKPKGSNVIQDLSDRAYINRFRRDMKLEKQEAIKQAIAEDKMMKHEQRMIKQAEVAERNTMLKTRREASSIIQKERAKLRMR